MKIDENFIPAYFQLGVEGEQTRILEVVLCMHSILHNIASYKVGEVDAEQVTNPSMVDSFLQSFDTLCYKLQTKTDAIEEDLVRAFTTHKMCLVGLITELVQIAGEGFDEVISAAKAMMNPIEVPVTA